MFHKKAFALVFFLAVSVYCAKKSKVEQKLDALENLLDSKMYLVNEKLETGREEREMILQKLNKTMEYIEEMDKTEAKTQENMSPGTKQIDLGTSLQQITENAQRMDNLSAELIQMKRGVEEEKKARKSDANAISDELDELKGDLKIIISNQNGLSRKLDNIIYIQADLDLKSRSLSQKLDKLENKASKSDGRMQAKLAKIKGEAAVIGQEIADLKEDVSPKLSYLQNCSTEQHHLLNEIIEMSMPVRLVNGSNPYEGRVEINYGGRRGSVCDGFWDNNNAQVVCRMLGYKGGTGYKSNQHSFGKSIGEMLLDYVQCHGHEDSLFHCYHGEFGKVECSYSYGVGVRCEP